jgi:predicted TIM-barrel fold metal-dependent hydrolase
VRAALALVVGAASLTAFFLLEHEARSGPATKAPSSSSHWERRVDVHTHLHPYVYKQALALMREFGGSVALNLSSVPDPEVVAALVKLGEEHGGRILSFTGVDWRLLSDPETFGARAADALERSIQAGARGVKISKGLGLGYAWPDQTRVAVDDARLDPVFERAAKMGVPVAIHVGDPVAFWDPVTPDNERFDELSLNPQWSLAGREGIPSHKELMAEAERRYARHSNLTFIAVHVAGHPEDLDAVDALLDRNPNVYVDLAARVPELGRHPPDRARAFFEKHQDRILFGTDLGLGPRSIMLGAPLKERETREDVERFFSSTRRYLETNDRGFEHPTPIQGRWKINGVGLADAVLEKIYVTNAAKLFSIPEARLTPLP